MQLPTPSDLPIPMLLLPRRFAPIRLTALQKLSYNPLGNQRSAVTILPSPSRSLKSSTQIQNLATYRAMAPELDSYFKQYAPLSSKKGLRSLHRIGKNADWPINRVDKLSESFIERQYLPSFPKRTYPNDLQGSARPLPFLQYQQTKNAAKMLSKSALLLPT